MISLSTVYAQLGEHLGRSSFHVPAPSRVGWIRDADHGKTDLMADYTDLFPEPTEADIARIKSLLRQIGGDHVVWGASQVFDVLKTEHQMRAERMATNRLVMVSWVLAAATVVLAFATVALIFATLAD